MKGAWRLLPGGDTYCVNDCPAMFVYFASICFSFCRWLFPRIWGFGENVQQVIPCLHFFFYVEISLHTLIPLLMSGSVHSGSASWDDCDQVFLRLHKWDFWSLESADEREVIRSRSYVALVRLHSTYCLTHSLLRSQNCVHAVSAQFVHA